MCDPVTAGYAIGGAIVADYAVDALTPDLPSLPDAPASPPNLVDPKAQAARTRERDRARAASGISSTILTGGGGLTTQASTAPKTLLGQ